MAGGNNYWGPNSKGEQERLKWVIIHNKDFRYKPATILEFLGPGHLDLDPDQNPSLDKRVCVRPGIKRALIEIFGEKIDPERISQVRRALFTGGIGIGKTTLASIALTYMVHWVLCLKNPQQYFGLFPGSRIAFMLMSTKGSQTKEVLFEDIKARVQNSPWFQLYCPFNDTEKRRTNQLRFENNIWVIPGNSEETTFEGYNILGGILDEGDSHKVTANKDYADAGWDTIENRISSRFKDLTGEDHRGLIIAIGQMKQSDGFMARKKGTLEKDIEAAVRAGKRPDAVVVQMSIWESHGWDKYKDKKGKVPVFYYDALRRQVIPDGPGNIVKHHANVKKIPRVYLKEFQNDPVKALKDLAGIPPQVDDPFISMVDRVDEAMEKYENSHPDLLVPVSNSPFNPRFNDRLVAANSIRRVLHVDIGYAAQGDCLGMAMGHVSGLIEQDGEEKPYIVIDFLLRIQGYGGNEIQLADFRKKIYELRDDRHFKIGLVSFDGFQSTDSQQILRQKKFNTALVSVDRSKGPYEDLREAINDRRIEFPRYMTRWRRGDSEDTCVIRKELLELTDTGRKIDHQPKGSKDVADAMAGVVHTLMGSSTYRRGARKMTSSEPDDSFDFSQVTSPDPVKVLNPLQMGVGAGEDVSFESLLSKDGPRGLPPVERLMPRLH